MIGLLVGCLAGRVIASLDVGAAIQGALDAQHDEDTMLLSCGIDHPTPLQRYVARIYGQGITAECRNQTWVCEECRIVWTEGQTQCWRCGNRTRTTLPG